MNSFEYTQGVNLSDLNRTVVPTNSALANKTAGASNKVGGTNSAMSINRNQSNSVEHKISSAYRKYQEDKKNRSFIQKWKDYGKKHNPLNSYKKGLHNQTNYDRQKAMQNRQFIMEMYGSNTAYRRAIRDMKKAGINPYAIGKLAPASSPTVSGSYSHSNAGAQNLFMLVNSALKVARVGMAVLTGVLI